MLLFIGDEGSSSFVTEIPICYPLIACNYGEKRMLFRWAQNLIDDRRVSINTFLLYVDDISFNISTCLPPRHVRQSRFRKKF